MYSKLRFPLGLTYPIALIITYISVLIEIILTGKPIFSVIFFGAFFIVIGILQFIRYRMWVYLFLGILFGTSTWHSLSYFLFPGRPPISNLIHILVNVLFIILFWPRLSAQERLVTNARRLLNLASSMINDTSGGFTSRPYSGGKISISNMDLKGFIKFMEGKYIVKAYVKEDVYFLGFSMGVSPIIEDDPLKISHVLIDREKNLSVRISAFDYKRYKMSLNFDHLCQSMTEVFVQFIEYYKQGREDRIINELKAAK
ncbi:MAG: hypothetical protein QNK30_13845 [Bacteroidales bacterium]|nr:hypothetical protein [Bacteroidales bacterium]